MLDNIYKFCSNMLQSGPNPAHELQKHGFIIRAQVLDWTAYSPDLFPTDTVQHIMKLQLLTKYH